MKNIDFVGKKIIKRNGDVFEVISANWEGRVVSQRTIILNDGKNGYGLENGLKSALIKFEDNYFQAEVEKELGNGDPPPPPPPPQPPTPLEDVLQEAVNLFKEKSLSYNISREYFKDFSNLIQGKKHGRKALDIYDSCCRNFGFRWSLRGYFGLQQILYAQNATPENLSVWMLPNNTYTGKTSGAWANVIKDDLIYEVRIIDDEGHSDDRVTFAKQADGHYVFMGIYGLEESIKIEKEVEGIFIKWVKVYKRFSSVYPE